MFLQLKGVSVSEDCHLVSAETTPDFKGYIPLVVYDNSKIRSGQYREDEELEIGISIFVYDGTPNNKLVRKIYFKKIRNVIHPIQSSNTYFTAHKNLRKLIRHQSAPPSDFL